MFHFLETFQFPLYNSTTPLMSSLLQHFTIIPSSTSTSTMAKTSQISSTHFTIFLLLSIFTSNFAIGEQENSFLQPIDTKLMTKFMKKEKFSHFRVYWHDIVGGRNPSSVAVVPPPKNSTTAFGLINMIDNPLTTGPEMSSKMVGKAQGFYSSASQQNVELLMAMNFAFSEGKYNGSTITIMGRNPVFSKVREMPVIGGSGLFRFARGYVQARTHWFDLKTGDAIVKYDCYVIHY